MRSVFRIVAPGLLLLPGLMAQPQGLTPEWDIRSVLKEISAHAGRLIPVLDKAQPQAWVEKGAPEAYVSQWKTLKEQSQALSAEALELARKPEKLADSLKAFFRMQSLEFMVGSFADGIRRYQEPEHASELLALAAENGANRARFQHYIVELAAQMEQEYEIMDREAQRCRGLLVRQPPAQGGAPGRK